MDDRVKKDIQERFKLLPKVVQGAITSSDVQKHLRELADTHKLHLDQWEQLENEVMLALLGFSRVEELATQIEKEVRVPKEIANTLAADISKAVFEPIRQELERELGNPEAEEKKKSTIEEMRSAVLSQAPRHTGKESAARPVSPPIQPATPPSPPPERKTVRAPTRSPEDTSRTAETQEDKDPGSATTQARKPASGAYKSGEASTIRKSVEDDPYREPPA